MIQACINLGGDRLIKIVKVIPREDYCLEIILDNGNSVILSIKSRLNTIRFGILEDIEFFNKVSTDGICISWDGKIEVSLSEIFQLAQK
ncbi:MAG: hypothetical protein K0R21_711 [Anaerocolumna sp.]|jgi:hypothetical protein|nr:hypothetical protein [Anaerocolumna sp.]